VTHGSEPRLPAGVGSGAAPWFFVGHGSVDIKKGLAGLDKQLDSRVYKAHSHISKVFDVQSIMACKTCGQVACKTCG
jgi:hypothetical protein